MKDQAKTPETSGEQTIEQLQKRYEKLNTRKIQAETNLENTQNRLEALKKEAREKYETDDVGELRKKLAAMKLENEEKRRKYQADLDQIERNLNAVEEKFAVSENDPSSQEGST